MTVNFIFPKKPVQVQRARGYRDHGSEQSTESKIRKSANAAGVQKKLDGALLLRIDEINTIITFLKEDMVSGNITSALNGALIADLEEESQAVRDRLSSLREAGVIRLCSDTELLYDEYVRNDRNPYDDAVRRASSTVSTTLSRSTVFYDALGHPKPPGRV
jgi:hypothetical protein